MARLRILKEVSEKHLLDNDVSYIEHAKFSGNLSLQFLKMSVAAAVHAALPCFFITHSSEGVRDLYWTFASKR